MCHMSLVMSYKYASLQEQATPRVVCLCTMGGINELQGALNSSKSWKARNLEVREIDEMFVLSTITKFNFNKISR